MEKDKNNLKYDLNQHLWIAQEGQEALIGITDYAQEQLEEILFVELPELNSFKKGDYFMCIESGKTDQDLNAPFDLEVIEVNDDLDDEPELLSEDPFGTWICKVKIKDDNQISELGNITDYEAIIEED